MKLSTLTGHTNWFEDFSVGQRMRHARAATIDEVENNYITKQVMNTAQGHWNEEIMAGSPLGNGWRFTAAAALVCPQCSSASRWVLGLSPLMRSQQPASVPANWARHTSWTPASESNTRCTRSPVVAHT